MDCNHELYYRESNMSCNFRYESVVGTGRVAIVPEEEKEKALTLLMNHYHPESVKFNPKFVHMTQCMKIIVNDMTAKRAMPKKNTLDYKVMQFQGEVRSPHMYEEKNRS
jgi:nitroimidazol reductase NimA-like FMN-containing flavoprotein (pyridoxamine 5'-phosphate oxidase superfamily)